VGRGSDWLIERSRLSQETVIGRMLAADQSNKPAPRQATLNKLVEALECRFSDFEEFLKSTRVPGRSSELADLKLVIP
jgi:hypothetical protein